MEASSSVPPPFLSLAFPLFPVDLTECILLGVLGALIFFERHSHNVRWLFLSPANGSRLFCFALAKEATMSKGWLLPLRRLNLDTARRSFQFFSPSPSPTTTHPLHSFPQSLNTPLTLIPTARN